MTRRSRKRNILAMTLGDWLSENGVRMDDFARDIGVHLVTAYKLRTGKCLPSVRVLAAIERRTNGQVTARDFVPASETEH